MSDQPFDPEKALIYTMTFADAKRRARALFHVQERHDRRDGKVVGWSIAFLGLTAEGQAASFKDHGLDGPDAEAKMLALADQCADAVAEAMLP